LYDYMICGTLECEHMYSWDIYGIGLCNY
jgi:hypothetical protein